MAEASNTKSFSHVDFTPGWVVQRGTAAKPSSLLMLENAYVDTDNTIHGRGGIDNINEVAFTDGTDNENAQDVHSHRLIESTRYIGVGSKVKRFTALNVDPGIDIITGLSGRRLFMATVSPSPGTSERWTYFGNGDSNGHGAASGDCRKKDNSSLTRNWGIDGPRAVVTVALGNDQPDVTSVETFSSSYPPQDGNGTNAAAPVPYAGAGQEFTVPVNKTERYLRGVVVDMSPYTDTGFVRVMLRVDRAQHLDHVELAFNVDVSPSGIVDDFFQHKIFAEEFEKDNVWQEFKVRKSAFKRVKPTEGSQQDWSDLCEIQVTVAAANLGDDGDPRLVKVSAADLRIEDDTHPDGVFDYRLTWWNDDLKIRSNPLALVDLYAAVDRTSAKINAQRQRIIITRTPVTTADPQVTHWELWRRNHNGGGIFAYLDRIAYATLTYNDDKVDLELGEELLNGIGDNEIPPAGRFICSFDDRMFVMGMNSGAFAGGLVFTGSGLNDMSLGEGSTANTNINFVVIIDGTGTPNTFKYSIDGGATFFATGVAITGADQILAYGQVIRFAALVGHTVGNQWTFTSVKTGEEESRYSVRYSRRFRPESFPLENYFLVGGPSDVIRGFSVWQNQLWIWTKKTVYRVNPVENSYIAQVTEAPVGTDSPYSITESPFGIFYYAPEDGPYVFDGATAVSIASQQLDPFFGREFFQQDGIRIAPVAMNVVAEFENVIGQYYNRWFWLVVDDEEQKCLVVVYNCEAKRWHRNSGRGFNIRRLFWEKGGNDIASADNLEGGTSDGYLILYEPLPRNTSDFEASAPGNEPIKITIQQTFDSVLKPDDAEIDIKDLMIDAELEGQGVLVEASFDDSPLQIIGAQIGHEREKLFFPVKDWDLDRQEYGRICYKVSVRLTIEQSTYRVVIFANGIRYWPEPRRSPTYSAQYFAQGEAVWARRGQFYLRSYAPVEMIFYFDTLELYRVRLPNTEGARRNIRPSVPTGVRGAVGRVIFQSDEPFVLYPQSYIEMGSFGVGSQGMLQWQLSP